MITVGIFLFVIGACVGSFLNVCIWRLPKNLSIVKPASFCPSCKTPIRWFDNVPILGYFFVGGKCRSCHNKVSLRYPLVELLTAIVFVVLYAKIGLTGAFFTFLFFFCLLIVVSFIDIDYHAIPAYLCVVGILVGLFLSLIATVKVIKTGVWDYRFFPIVGAVKALIFGFGFTYLFKIFGDFFMGIYLSWRKKESIEGETESLGLGDVDFMGMVGVFMGSKAVVLAFFIAPFFAAAYSIVAIIFKKSHLIPYLPYLSLAAVTVYFWGQPILRLFFNV